MIFSAKHPFKQFSLWIFVSAVFCYYIFTADLYWVNPINPVSISLGSGLLILCVVVQWKIKKWLYRKYLMFYLDLKCCSEIIQILWQTGRLFFNYYYRLITSIWKITSFSLGGPELKVPTQAVASPRLPAPWCRFFFFLFIINKSPLFPESSLLHPSTNPDRLLFVLNS